MKSQTYIRKQKRIDRNTGVMIHLFAAAHAITAVVTRLLNYYDDIPLTVLTISMLVLIATRRRMPLPATAVMTLAVTLLGYLLGVWFGQKLDSAIASPLLAAAVTTFALTEIFGWSIWMLTARIKTEAPSGADYRTAVTRQIIIAAFLILLVRVTYSLIFRSPYFVMHGGIYAQFGQLFSNTFATLTLLCFAAILASLPKPGGNEPKWKRSAALSAILVSLILFPLLPAVISYYDFPMTGFMQVRPAFNRYSFAGLYAVALLSTIIIYTAALMVKYLTASRHAFRTERSKKLSEQYKYAKLKQQISPHFLFNSLNILDSLVRSGESERAGDYIRKLASLYRYILKNEEEQLVTLDEELEFTDKYIDLLKVRFADGLSVDNAIPDSARKMHIVPCGLQMLIENAIKHNIVGSESPLRVTVSVDGEFISVANNLQPRISTQPSTRLSLKNLSRQYENIAGVGIEVLQSETEFRVRLPLL